MRYITTHDAPATGLRGIADTSWHVRGACHGMDVEDADAVFFPGPRDYEDIAEAKELCGWCPVRRECLDFALENVLKEGVWGGLTEDERRPLHEGLSQRLDYRRVTAFFQGRDVHLTEAERQVVIDHAYVRGWRPAQLAPALQISHKHARDLLRQAANKVFARDRKYGVPRPKKKRKKTSTAASTRTPAAPGTRQPTTRPATSASATPETASGRTPSANAGPAPGVRRPVPARSGLASPPVQPSQKRCHSSSPVKPIEDCGAGPGVTRPEGWVQLSFLEAPLAHAPVGKAA